VFGQALTPPAIPSLNALGAYGIVVAGVGGTGVITIGQLLGMAAHIEGKGIVTQDAAGLAQKGGATWSHVLLAASQDQISTTRVAMAAADLIIGCDPIVTAGKETTLRMRAGRTHVALNAHSTPTAAFVKNANWQNPAENCVKDIAQAVGDSGVGTLDADLLAVQFMGDSLYTNPLLLGYAWQRGWLPLEEASLLRAMELNEVAVEKNKTAFAWGRRAAQNLDKVLSLLKQGTEQVVQFKPRDTLEALVARRVDFLTSYQNAAYAQSYAAFVAQVQAAEAPTGKTSLSEAVARYLFKLMAYKDDQFEGDFKVHHHLAPPLLSKRNERGELIKQKFGPAMQTGFKWLARFKGLRGTALDIFGCTEERRTERALIVEYRDMVASLLPRLNAQNHAQALALASLPEGIRGYGHVKARHLAQVKARWQTLLAEWSAQAA
jgi:indolepyruvate ferredoxin oxidoreductase